MSRSKGEDAPSLEGSGAALLKCRPSFRRGTPLPKWRPKRRASSERRGPHLHRALARRKTGPGGAGDVEALRMVRAGRGTVAAQRAVTWKAERSFQAPCPASGPDGGGIEPRSRREHSNAEPCRASPLRGGFGARRVGVVVRGVGEREEPEQGDLHGDVGHGLTEGGGAALEVVGRQVLGEEHVAADVLASLLRRRGGRRGHRYLGLPRTRREGRRRHASDFVAAAQTCSAW